MGGGSGRTFGWSSVSKWSSGEVMKCGGWWLADGSIAEKMGGGGGGGGGGSRVLMVQVFLWSGGGGGVVEEGPNGLERGGEVVGGETKVQAEASVFSGQEL